jgi:predicted RNase H-like HicB family nuclease
VTPRYVLSDYVAEALAEAAFEKLEDGSYAGRIPFCTGVVAFGTTLRECENELRPTLEDWLPVGLQLLLWGISPDEWNNLRQAAVGGRAATRAAPQKAVLPLCKVRRPQPFLSL